MSQSINLREAISKVSFCKCKHFDLLPLTYTGYSVCQNQFAVIITCNWLIISFVMANRYNTLSVWQEIKCILSSADTVYLMTSLSRTSCQDCTEVQSNWRAFASGNKRQEIASMLNTLKCLSIGTPNTTTSPFVPNGKWWLLSVPIFEHIIIRL